MTTTLTTIELAAHVGLTPKAIRSAIQRGELRATRLGRGRIQNTFVIQREDADAWIKWRAERKIKRAIPSVRQKGVRVDPKAEHFGFFPNHDEDTMERDWIEDMKRAALQGDQQAKDRLQLPWEDGGIGLKIWIAARIGTEI